MYNIPRSLFESDCYMVKLGELSERTLCLGLYLRVKLPRVPLIYSLNRQRHVWQPLTSNCLLW